MVVLTPELRGLVVVDLVTCEDVDVVLAELLLVLSEILLVDGEVAAGVNISCTVGRSATAED